MLFAEEELLLLEHKKTLEALERLIVNASKAVSDVGYNDSQNVTLSTSTVSANESSTNVESASNSQKSLSSFSPLSQKQIPEYYVDPSTKLMYLTPLGRKQVSFCIRNMFKTRLNEFSYMRSRCFISMRE